MKLRRALQLAFVVAVASCCSLTLVTGDAAAFRKPHAKERRALTRAWKKHHKKKARRLHRQQIRISTRNKRYAAVLYDDKGFKRGEDTGPSRIDYFKRRRHHKHPRRHSLSAAGAGDIVYDFQNVGTVPSRVRSEDLDPHYRVTYETTVNEKITREVTWGCPNGGGTVEDKGDYKWSVTWPDVPLTRPDFNATRTVGSSFGGSQTYHKPCNGYYAPGCPKNPTFHYRGAPSVAQQVSSSAFDDFFDSRHLIVEAQSTKDGCPYGDAGADPITQVEVALPHSWFGGKPAESESWDVDGGDFTKLAKSGRLRHCQATVDGNSCSESLESFEGRVRIVLRHGK